jgi:hypothetical protein
MKKKLSVVAIVFALVFLSYLTFTTVDSKTPTAVAAGKTYTATLYVAGMGGHFAKADVTIDPGNADDPIKVNNLDRIEIGTKDTHPTHDARIDNTDSNTMFWSTYKLDPTGKMHVGKSDLKTGKVIKDVVLTPDPKAPGAKPPVYCASGQTKSSYMPVFMGTEGYIDVFDKKSMDHKHRMFVSDLGYKAGTYKFVHGVNSPDMKSFLVVINQAAEGKGNGKVDFILVDLAALEAGKWKEIKRATITGTPEKTLTFRQYFTNDSKTIYESAGDRLWVINAADLKLIDEKMVPIEGQQIHDAMPSPDGKYAVLTVREVTSGCDVEGKPIQGKDVTDGTLLLYDAGAKKLVGKASSVCIACHKGMGIGDRSAVLCGIDGNWKM